MARQIIQIRVRGLEDVIRRLRAARRDIETALAGALYREGERIMEQSKRLVPVDTGALRSTGHTALPVRDGNKITVTLGYGGPAGAAFGGREVGYAIYVHENLTARHKVGQAKYLEQPALEAVSGMATRIAAALRREI